ncbi:hypothetical protein DFA_00041 [Cavenderia fasciculata]|uniref:Protein-S-isoprenylcysteine O-methyltransferase n=1 Tax=Cavenderia fasciculata TaxID=261658 RepID=F4PXF4_CACFS|nr:uncharacterized protein DFA_00041 [Cavenderia fasciculata]EGG19464.1 hypothetical protein DFA_00041 [Cavenderia fasciculata]|eukprot:XP_004357758.1 hypothetical protein DFA_00041 [Cavenderia fasciculata]
MTTHSSTTTTTSGIDNKSAQFAWSKHGAAKTVCIAYALGIAMGVGISVYFYSDSFPTFGLYLTSLSIFHLWEYIWVSMYDTSNLSSESFLLNHSREYHLALLVGFSEFWIEWYLFPSLKQFGWISFIGLIGSLGGQALRTVAMITAGRNFSHLIQEEKRKHHKLVTNGIYQYIRHPSYCGWFIWSVSTQLLMFNPICILGFAYVSWQFFSDRIDYEEDTLIEFFGNDYKEYKKKKNLKMVKEVGNTKISMDEIDIPTTNNSLNHQNGQQSIDLEKSEIDFKTTSFILENESKNNRLNNKDDGDDLENRVSPDDDSSDFKLRQYFEDSQRMSISNGSKPKKMGISVHNLSVIGIGADVSVIKDMLSPLFFIFNPFKWKRNNGITFNILNNIDIFCKDGEMLLVLGRPGAGCSTMLRMIANVQRDTYVNVKGTVSYGGLDSERWSRYRGEAIYIPEEDCHFPTLTLHQTLDFALKCKTPGNRLPDETKRSFRQKIYKLMLDMYGLVNQSNTIVGNAFIRGLSGGERKRTTITEAMVSAAPINCWDCSTRGLDSASALDYAKSLRIMTDTLDKTTIATFYQASESIYRLFDKVLVLEKGKCIYFGPTDQAKQYFVDLGFDCEPRKSTPDYLTGVTNPQERNIRQGFESSAPQTSFEFEDAWLHSSSRSKMLQEQMQFDQQLETEQPYKIFAQQVESEKSKTTPNSRPYTTSFFTQVRALTIRQFQIIWGNKVSMISRYISVLFQAFVYGSLFFQQPNDMNGLFTRCGAIFGSILFNSFLSQGELIVTFMGRQTLQKHKTYAMYRPSAYHLAQVITDLPIIAFQVLLFSIIAYFMFGLQYRVEQFFFWIFSMIGLTLCITNIIRALGHFSPSLYASQNVMSVYLLLLLCYAGFTVPYPKLHPWLSWFLWINPFSYGFKALTLNEFENIIFDCNQTAIPYGPTYQQQSSYRTCPIPGSVPGQLSISGESYLKIYLFWVLFIILNMFALEFIDWTSGGYTKKVYKKGKAPKINDSNQEEKKINKMVQEANENIKNMSLDCGGGVLTWQHIKYTVPVPGGKRLLLDDIQGWIKPGQMTALVGSTGAGKTTLLDVLAKRKTLGTVQGDIRLNGKPLEIDFERITGYIEQMDVFSPNLTVREALRFSAKMRQDPKVPIDEKYQYVESILEMIEMKHLGDALIGDLESGVGISVEERKRLTIGIELVAKPHILFLDEPTSGLDSQSSYNIIKFIRKLADAGIPLVCTIHQPSPVLFEYFDRLLLLAKGGKMVYFGDIGERSSLLTSYFTRYGARPCTESENPAEYILEVIGAGVYGKSNVDWSNTWKSSPEYQQVTLELEQLSGITTNNLSSSLSSSSSSSPPREFSTPLAYQIWQVYKRMNIIYWRDPFYSFGRWVQGIVVGLIIGLTYFNLQFSSSDMNQRVFFVFQGIILGIMMIFASLPQLFEQRNTFRRDYASRLYHWIPFALSMVAVELPYLVVTSTLFYVCAYWLAGLGSDAETNFYFWLTFTLFLFFCVSIGQAVGAFCETMFLAKFVIPVIIAFLFLFCGVLAPPQNMPLFWRSWIYHLMPTRYLMEGFVTNILKDVNVRCTDEDLIRFTSPPGQSCEQYTQPFSQYSTGYTQQLSSPQNDTCGYCIYSNGSEYYHTLGWSESNRYRNLLIIVVVHCSLCVVSAQALGDTAQRLVNEISSNYQHTLSWWPNMESALDKNTN